MRKIIIIAGPTGIGKTYTGRQLTAQFPQHLAFAPVHTTRQPRPEESIHTKERIFVDEAVFQDMVNQKAFFVYEQFADNLYGYSRESLAISDRHLLVDVSPYLLPSFANHSDIIIIGLQAPANYVQLIESRMALRGDPRADRARRWPFIERDIADLNKQQEFINRHGKFFYVQDDNTIDKEVLPWLIQQLDVS